VEPKHWHELLRWLVDRGTFDAAAEIGVAAGQRSRGLLLAGFRRVYLVDLWAHAPEMRGDLARSDEDHESWYQQCLVNVAEFADRAIILRGWSHEMAERVADESLDLVFIDATHEYDSVMRDLTHWYPKLKPGGVMSGHDYLAPEYTVRQAADEFAAGLGKTCLVLEAESVPDASFWFCK